MPDEYVAHYSGFSHAQLWEQLRAGDPEQIDTIATGWKQVSTTLSSVADGLARDLNQLASSWESDSGREFAKRVGAISKFSAGLSNDCATLNDGLEDMAAGLREAQSKAEDPADTADNDSTIGFAAVGTVVAGPVGGYVGAQFGHDRDVEQREKAKNRMVAVVAKLSGDYELVRHSSLEVFTPLPPELPTDTGDGTAHLRRQETGSVSDPGSAGAGGGHGTKATGNPTTAHAFVSSTGDGTGGSGTGTGSSGSVVTGGVSGFDTSTDGSGLSGTATVDGHTLAEYENLGTSLSGAGGPLTGGGAGGGGLGASGLGGTGASSLTMGGLGGGASLGSGAGFGGGLGGGLPLGVGGQPAGTGLNSVAQTGGRGLTGGAGGGEGARGGLQGDRRVGEARNGMGYRGNADSADEQNDERSTWLTEDELVWTGNDDVAPGVLGA